MNALLRTASALLLPALLLTGCGEKERPVLSVRPIVSKCPALQVPAELLERPAVTDFLSPSE